MEWTQLADYKWQQGNPLFYPGSTQLCPPSVIEPNGSDCLTKVGPLEEESTREVFDNKSPQGFRCMALSLACLPPQCRIHGSHMWRVVKARLTPQPLIANYMKKERYQCYGKYLWCLVKNGSEGSLLTAMTTIMLRLPCQHYTHVAEKLSGENFFVFI